jgi:hypothetical protein
MTLGSALDRNESPTLTAPIGDLFVMPFFQDARQVDASHSILNDVHGTQIINYTGLRRYIIDFVQQSYSLLCSL